MSATSMCKPKVPTYDKSSLDSTLQKIKEGTLLGSGNFGCTFGIDKDKIVKIQPLNESNVEKILKEIYILLKLNDLNLETVPKIYLFFMIPDTRDEIEIKCPDIANYIKSIEINYDMEQFTKFIVDGNGIKIIKNAICFIIQQKYQKIKDVFGFDKDMQIKSNEDNAKLIFDHFIMTIITICGSKSIQYFRHFDLKFDNIMLKPITDDHYAYIYDKYIFHIPTIKHQDKSYIPVFIDYGESSIKSSECSAIDKDKEIGNTELKCKDSPIVVDANRNVKIDSDENISHIYDLVQMSLGYSKTDVTFKEYQSFLNAYFRELKENRFNAYLQAETIKSIVKPIETPIEKEPIQESIVSPKEQSTTSPIVNLTQTIYSPYQPYQSYPPHPSCQTQTYDYPPHPTIAPQHQTYGSNPNKGCMTGGVYLRSKNMYKNLKRFDR